MANKRKGPTSWIQVARSHILPEWISRNPEAFRLLYEFACRARRIRGTIEYRGELISLNEREFITGRINTSKEVGISEYEYRSLYKKFEKVAYIQTIKSTKHFTIGKFLADEIFYSNPSSEQPSIKPSRQPSNSHQTATKKNDKERKESKSSKNSFAPCSNTELYEIAVALEIPLDSVTNKHAQIIEMSSSGEMEERYPRMKSTYSTLLSWLRNDVTKGYIQQLDELGLLALTASNPANPGRAELEAKKQKMKEDGLL